MNDSPNIRGVHNDKIPFDIAVSNTYSEIKDIRINILLIKFIFSKA